MEPIRSRQIHLDFHTSELIRGIGSRFDKRQWQNALRTGRVNLINVFAKCHHSWSYYPTTVGMRHPHLRLDLLGAQLEACHEIGVRCPIYFTVGWSAADAELHPEWCIRNRDGSICAPGWDRDATPDTPKPGVQWKCMCPSGGYHELMTAQVEELCTGYEVDGFWFDIYQAERLCWCDLCLRGMLAAGLDIDHREDVQRYRADTMRRHMAEMVRLITGHHPAASIYFNGVTRLDRDANARYRLYRYNTQNDLEDLPTTWGGYDKLALRARHFANVGKPYVAMSGKFHTSWGEFGGFKHPDALRFEAASMVAYGAACNFGDQLHPSGEIDLDTYRNIGAAFAYVERIEQYGIGGRPAARLGLWRSGSDDDDGGVSSMLLETQTDYRVVADDDDLSGYDAIVLPGGRFLTAAEARRLDDFAGGLLILGAGGLLAGEDRFALDAGVEYLGPGRYDVDYLCAGESLGDELVRSPFLCYESGLRTVPAAGAEVLARIREPHFSRTYGAYCGHLNTPYGLQDAAHPGAVRKGRRVFLAHHLGRIYHAHGARVHRQLFRNALALVYPTPTAQTRMPSAGRLSLLHQPEHRRYVAHLLYATPLQRGRCLVIEDLVPLHEVPLQLTVPEEVASATLVPQRTALEVQRSGGSVAVTVPEVHCHQAVVFSY